MSTVKSTKCVRKLERPRPLRLNSDSDGASTASTNGPANGVLTDSPEPLAFPEEEVVRELERLHTSVNNGNFDATLSAQIGSLCAMLAAKGASMDSANREVLDRYFVTLRNAAREERLDACSRLRLLQMIELRGMGWQGNRNVQDFYQRMIQQLEEEESEQRTTDSSTSPSGASLLNSSWTPLGKASTQKQLAVQSLSTVAPAKSPPQPTDIAKSVGVSGQLAGIPGRNLPRDGAAMQGLDSGRVPVVPGAREHRPVQTRGRPSGEEGALGRNKDLVGRSASPAVQGGGDGTAAGHRAAPETNQRLSLVQRGGMGDASTGGFTATLNVAGDTVRISGGNPALVRACKMVVEKYFAGEMVFSDRATAEWPAQREDERAAKASSSPEPVIHGSAGGLTACGPGDLQSGGHQAGSPSGGEGEAVGRPCRGGPQNTTVAAAQSAKCAGVVENVALQADADASSTVDARGQARKLKRRESCPAFSARSRPPQVQSSVSLEASDPLAGAPPSSARSYSRDFLLQCSQSDLALQPPPDFPPLDPEVENLMVKESRPPQVQSSVSLEASDPPAGASPSRTRSYSRDFLLQCSQSDLALRPPPDFPPLDPEVENLMVKEDRRHSAARQEGN